jgi:hypothetical protein
MTSRLWSAVLFLVLASAGLGPGLAAAGTPEEEIAYLLQQVEKSPLIFVRNSQEYSGREAARHLRQKQVYFQEQIKTAEDFIRLAASHSLMSGKPYLVQLPDGRREECRVWLTRELQRFRAGK